jgi:hypothetical protein
VLAAVGGTLVSFYKPPMGAPAKPAVTQSATAPAAPGPETK